MITKDKFDFKVFDRQYELPLGECGSKTKEQILVAGTVLFAINGYAAVSMRDLASATGLKPASLYNHFDGKESLWQAVMDHAAGLYRLYFQHLGEALGRAASFEEGLGRIFQEPKKWSNIFTCYAFSLIQAEQFRDERAGQIFNGTFLEFSIDFIKKWFERWIAQGFVKPFNTSMTATIIMHGVLLGNNIKVQELLGRQTAYDPGQMMEEMEAFIIDLTSAPEGS